METMKECDCKGCDIAPNCTVNDDKAEICPCRICIVKGLCEEACDDYHEWRKHI